MSKAIKKMCTIKPEEVNKVAKELKDQVTEPKFLCTKCLRVAADKKVICKAEKIKKLKTE